MDYELNMTSPRLTVRDKVPQNHAKSNQKSLKVVEILGFFSLKMRHFQV